MITDMAGFLFSILAVQTLLVRCAGLTSLYESRNSVKSCVLIQLLPAFTF